jgi:cysteine desulfurase
MPGVAAETQVMAFDLDGIAVSAGAACSSGKVQASQVLQAMGIGEDLAGYAIRISFGWSTTAAEIDRFIEAWIRIHGRLRATVQRDPPLRRGA